MQGLEVQGLEVQGLEVQGFEVQGRAVGEPSIELRVSGRDELAAALRHLVTAGVAVYAVVPGRPMIEEMVARLLSPDFEGAVE